MYQGTTPSVTFVVKGYDLSTANVFVSFKRGDSVLTKSGTDVISVYDAVTEKSTVVCPLTQEETLAMKQGSVTAQIRFVYEDGMAYATDKATIEIKDVIYREVITFGGGA